MYPADDATESHHLKLMKQRRGAKPRRMQGTGYLVIRKPRSQIMDTQVRERCNRCLKGLTVGLHHHDLLFGLMAACAPGGLEHLQAGGALLRPMTQPLY